VVLSAALASGFFGIEHKTEPEPCVEGNSYDRKHPEKPKFE
jgi:glutamine synthetase